MNHDIDTDIKLADGTVVRFGYNNPDVLRFASAPAFDEANPVLPESEWEEHNDYEQHRSPIDSQDNNNCTNAALANQFECVCRAAGIEDVPRLSWSFLYALNNGGRDQGAFCRDLAKMLRDGPGLPPVSVCPDSQIYVPRGGMPNAALKAAEEFQALEIYQCLNWSHVASALTQRFTVYHGFVLGSSFFNVGKDGKVPRFDGRNRNGHAMWSCGLTKRFGDWRTITPNSWGRGFGDQGVGYIDRSYFWEESGRMVNLDAYAIRAVKRKDKLPTAAN